MKKEEKKKTEKKEKKVEKTTTQKTTLKIYSRIYNDLINIIKQQKELLKFIGENETLRHRKDYEMQMEEIQRKINKLGKEE